MRVLSVNVGLPRELGWRGKPLTTGIHKQPVASRVAIRALNLDGDRQADLRAKALVLTAEGRAVRAKAVQRMAEPPPSLATLSAADRRARRAILGRIETEESWPRGTDQ